MPVATGGIRRGFSDLRPCQVPSRRPIRCVVQTVLEFPWVILLQWGIGTVEIIENMRSSIIQPQFRSRIWRKCYSLLRSTVCLFSVQLRRSWVYSSQGIDARKDWQDWENRYRNLGTSTVLPGVGYEYLSLFYGMINA